MKILLISPKGPLYRFKGGIFKRSLRYAPLTLTTLASLVPPELNATIRIIDEGIDEVDLNADADLIGITAITGTAPRAYELARHFRSRGIPVVMGGPHVTLIPEDAQPHADSIVVGYAEDSWPQLLRDFKAGRLQPRYDQAPDLSLANRPFPWRHMLPRRHYVTAHVFEATRGCIHNCEFCVVPAAWGRKPYQKPVEDVVADIRQQGAASEPIIFIDLNIIADRHYAARLFEALIPLKVQWFGLATSLLGEDDGLLQLAARSGCTGLLIGLESISSDNLHAIGKGFNMPTHYGHLVEKLHRHGISLMGCFVFGMDHDTPEVFLETAKFAVEARIDLPRFAISTPFPGTALYHRLSAEGRIFTRNWELYDGQHVVFYPRQMTVEELQQGTERAWKYTYRYSSIARRLSASPGPLWKILAANFGYRFYAHHLQQFYHCDSLLMPALGSSLPEKDLARA